MSSIHTWSMRFATLPQFDKFTQLKPNLGTCTIAGMTTNVHDAKRARGPLEKYCPRSVMVARAGVVADNQSPCSFRGGAGAPYLRTRQSMLDTAR